MKKLPSYYNLTNIHCTVYLFCVTLLFLLQAPSSYAQTSSASPAKYYVQHFGEEEGLSNTINSILPDEDGFLWLGTSNGLARFNGNRILPITISDPAHKNAVISINSILYKNKDTLLTCSQFLKKVETVVNGRVIKIEDQQFEKQGLFFSNQKFITAAPAFLKGNYSTSEFLKKTGWKANSYTFVGGDINKDTIWFTVNDGIGFYNKNGQVNKITIPDFDIFQLISTGNDIIYLDKTHHLNHYNAQGLQKRETLNIPHRKKISIYNNRFGKGFYCIADSSLYKVDISGNGELSFKLLMDNLKAPADVVVITEKDSNTIVTGTFSNGLYVYKKNIFKITEPLPAGQSNSFFIQQLLPDGQTIFAGKGNLFNNEVDYVKKIKGFDQLYFGILKDSKGRYWYPGMGKILRAPAIGAKADTIKTITGNFAEILLEDRNGRVWIASGSEFGYFQNDQYTEVKIKELLNLRVNCLRQDNNGKYYIGTDWGLFTSDNIDKPDVKEIPDFRSMHIRDFKFEPDGSIWVFTFANGFFLLSKQGITSFGEKKAAFDFIHTMIEDDRGLCWLPSNNGLFATRKKALIDYSKDKSNPPFFYKFSIKDGLRTNEFNGGTDPVYIRLPNGDISLTSMNGLVFFNPSKMYFSFSGSPIFINEILLDSIEIERTDNLEIGSKIENIHFAISTSYWGNKENDVLEYQVTTRDGAAQNSEWLRVDQSDGINLFSPGNGIYQLNIRKRTGFEATDFLYKTVHFYVLPAWYQTKLFLAAMIAAVLLMMLAIFFLRRNYYRRINEMMKRKVDAATIELQLMNITLENKVEERTLEIRKSEIKSRTLVEKSQMGVYIIQDNKFIYVNPRFEELTGYKSDEAIGMDPLLLFEKREQIIVTEKIRQRVSGEVESDRYEIEGRKKDGTACQWELFCSRTIYEGKTTLLGTMLDITERTKMQNELREAEMKFRDLVEKSLVGVYITTGRKLVYVNPRYAEMFGYSQDELIGLDSVPVTVYKDDIELVEKNIRARMEGKIEGIHYEFRAVKKDGSIIYIEAFGRMTEFEGNPAIIGTIIDITQKKLAEQQLIKEKDLSQSIINNLPGIFYVFDETSKYVLWNKNFEKITGYSAEEISNIPPAILIHKRDSERVEKAIEKIHTEGYADVEAALLCKDGREIPYYFNGISVNYNDKQCILGVGIDISERIKAQEEREVAIDALQKSEANLNTIFMNTDTVYILLDTDLKIIAFNQRAYDYIKKVYKGSLKINVDFTDYIAQSRRKKFREDAIYVMNGNQYSYEKSHLQPNGKYTWYYVRKFPVLQSFQHPLGMMMAISDITEKKLLEQEILDQKVQEQKKVIRAILTGEEKERNKIGQELHDNINQILAGTKLYLSVIEQEKSGNQHLKHSMNLLDSAIDEIRDLSKNKVTPPKSYSLAEMLQNLVDNFYVASKIETDFSYGGAAQLINEDLKLNIYRIVQEQLNNIIKHAHAKNIFIVVNVNEKNIRLFVSDDGKGFDVKSKKTGIGLANMTNRVEGFNGTIHIESSPGNGAKIDINLPL